MSCPAVILAGGQSRRMGGGDKGLRPLAGTTLLDRVIAGLGPQAAPLALNANGDLARFAHTGLPVLPDPVPGQPGPLAGILAALDWAADLGAAVVVTVPVDTPFLPGDLVQRLMQAGAPAVAAGGGRMHPVIGLWPVAARPGLAARLAQGHRRVGDWGAALDAAQVPFGEDDLFNVNTPDDLARAEGRLA